MKRIYVTFILLLVAICGFLGYKWYQSNQDYMGMLERWGEYFDISGILANFITSIGNSEEEINEYSIERTSHTYGDQTFDSVTWEVKDGDTELVVLENNSLWILLEGSDEYIRVI